MIDLLMQFIQPIMPVLIAAVAGGLVGIEREYRDKSAGFRTMILIAVGSALFTMMSLSLDPSSGEFTRVAAAVVSGVGFLGAGVILKDGATIRGLTTAAAIWSVASLGMAAGTGRYDMVVSVTSLILLVLWFLPYFERWFGRLHESLEVVVTIKNSAKTEKQIMTIFSECRVKILSIHYSRTAPTERTLSIKARMTPAKREALSKLLVTEKGIIAFKA